MRINRKVIAAYVTEAVESGDAELVAIALGDVARAKGMTEIANEAGLSREHLYRALRAGGNPEFGTAMRGCPRLGDHPMTPAERMRRYRQRKASQ
jgi:probable addiction module antidote protein